MKDHFFEATHCDRCGELLDKGRIMSMFNTQVICMKCKEQEEMRDDYKKAVDAIREEEAKGNRNFKGIGL